MNQEETILKVADNTGALELKLFRCSKKKSVATVGDKIKGSVQKSTPDASVKKGSVVDAVIIRVKAPIRREDGTVLRFDENACVIINADGNPKGTRIFGAVARELRKNFMKIVSLAQEVV